MKRSTKTLTTTALATILTASALFSTPVFAAPAEAPVKLLTAHFEPRNVVQVEAGDFHFLPGQVAPVHTHDAPAVGYVAKGTIIYQVEGEKPRILSEGDAFFEPVGPRILRFDNASANEEAIFIDFNFEQEGEPFIVFETAPTEAIDRRSLSTFDLKDGTFDQVDVYENKLATSETVTLAGENPTLGIVAQGVVALSFDGGATQRVTAGASFAVPAGATDVRLVNVSADVPAKVITFVTH